MKKMLDLVQREDWQKLRQSFLGTWKKTPADNVAKLRKWLGGNPDEDKVRIVMNYLTGTAFRMGKISHPEIQKLRDWLKDKRKELKK